MDVWSTMVGPKQAAHIFSAVDRSIRERSPIRLEYSLRQPGGSVRQIRSIGQLIPSRTGHGNAIMGTVFDLTDQHRTRTALREALELLRRLDTGKKPITANPRELAPVVAISPDMGWPSPGASELEAERFIGARGGLSARQFHRVRELMDRRQREPLAIGELAAAAGMSAAHFTRAFKRTTGKTPHRFLLEQRLERARSALERSPADKLAGVAIEFGFFDQSHFTRHFRRKFGVTPGDFVRQATLRHSSPS